MRSRPLALIASAAFLIIAPGTVAGYLPWLITRWRFGLDFGDSSALRAAGLALIAIGAAALLECFVRFAWIGLGTPAPVAPPRRLVVSGLYRHVRNPMYVAVVTLVIGQALFFGALGLLLYAAAGWLFFHLFVLGYEEPALRRQFPDDYERFTRAVPRWLPRLTPWRG
ncbi:MAG TPA: methyltransferase [Allosphingosinicella sp.]|nr:methyltransferase [Allosphingosinicella sp.]